MSLTKDDREGTVNKKQFFGIRYAARIGQLIQSRYPQIAEDYRADLSIPEIIGKYGLLKEFGLKNPGTANNAVHFALRGSNSSHNGVTYSGLLTEDEIGPLAERRRKTRSSLIGKLTSERGTGCHGLDYGRRLEVALRSHRTRGLTPWSDEERAYVSKLAESEKYKAILGGKTSYRIREMVMEVNLRFHNCERVRTTPAIRSFLRNREKKSKGD